MTVSARAILAYLKLASTEPRRLESGTASVRHRRVQRMPSNGRGFFRCHEDRQHVRNFSYAITRHNFRSDK